jgi:hypothetical protein
MKRGMIRGISREKPSAHLWAVTKVEDTIIEERIQYAHPHGAAGFGEPGAQHLRLRCGVLPHGAYTPGDAEASQRI